MKGATILILIVALAWACMGNHANETECVDATPSKEIKMGESSELALLMRQIHEDAKSWKKMLETGELVRDSANIYTQLVESTPTDADVTGPVFDNFALNYQKALSDFMETNDIEIAKGRYNILVSSCISCHQSYCPGPVKTIKKLYLPKGSASL